jgi:butyryl-CoA dehydrogenase
MQDDNELLVDSARRWAEKACTPAALQAARSHAVGNPPERWQALADMGWLGITVPEADGGLGGSLLQAGLVAHALGAACAPEPYLNAVMASALLQSLPASDARSQALQALASGEQRLAVAAWEPGFVGALSVDAMQATSTPAGWRLQGRKALTLGLAGADALLLIARISPQHAGVFSVAGTAAGVHAPTQSLYDGRHAAALQLSDAPAQLLWQGEVDAVLACMARATSAAAVMQGADTAGAAAAAFALTRDYVGTRRQFGQTIASMQVVQHRLVDVYVEIEEIESLWRAAAAEPDDAALVTALLVRTSEMARLVWQDCVQLHGAIGMTQEYGLSGWVQRLALATSWLGQETVHIDRLADLSLGTVG